jgi:hypothetical protein
LLEDSADIPGLARASGGLRGRSALIDSGV